MGYVSVVFDGPAGVGKSTIAKAIALELGFNYIDTGAMYRAATLFALEHSIPFDEENQNRILEIVLNKDFRFTQTDTRVLIYHGSRDLTEDIRSLEVTRNVSYLAALPAIRAGLRDLQRQMASSSNVVMEGRDIGTVVLPNATHKFYLVASVETRARRRLHELTCKGINVSYETILRDIEARDKLDSSRTHAPLRKAEDAMEINTSDLQIPEVISLVMSYITLSNSSK